MRKKSAPALNRFAMPRRCEAAGPSVAPRLSRGAVAGGGRRKHRHARWQRLHGCLIGRVGELDGPGRLVAGIDLEKACTIIAARQAIVGAADGELLCPRTHEGLAGPFAAAIVVDRVNVI